MKGVTLIELLFILALVGILALFAIASSSDLMNKNERQTLVDDMSSIVNYAKIKAILNGRPVFLSASDPNLDWSKGIILSQFNLKTKQTELLYQWQWRHPHWNVSWSGTDRSSRISFSNNPMKAISNGQFVLTNPSTKTQIRIVLNRMGRVRLGVVNDY